MLVSCSIILNTFKIFVRAFLLAHNELDCGVICLTFDLTDWELASVTAALADVHINGFLHFLVKSYEPIQN